METPQFAAVPETAIAQCLGNYTDRTGATTANRIELLTAAANGTKVTQIAVKCSGNSSAGLVLVFITDTEGGNPRLFDEIPYGTATANATVQSARNVVQYDDLQLKAGQKILVGAPVAPTIAVNVFAQKGDF
jgi:hypothetical protein